MSDPILLIAAGTCVAAPIAVWLGLHFHKIVTTLPIATVVKTPVVSAPTPAVALAPAPSKGTAPVTTVSQDIADFVSAAEKAAESAETFVSNEVYSAAVAAKAKAEQDFHDLGVQYDADVAALKAVVAKLQAKLPAAPAGGVTAPG